jgi:hypothetical protein
MRHSLACGTKTPRTLDARMAHYEECPHPECKARARKLTGALSLMARAIKLRKLEDHDSFSAD